MVGSGRKRKRLEKSKTQLKKPKTAPGKHLPSGTNVTKTNFKVAKIVIPGQQGESSARGGGPATSKRIGLKDVLSKVSHFSQAVRTDGLEGLQQLVSGPGAADLVSSHLPALLAAVVPLTQDRERKLRRLATSCLGAVLTLTPDLSLAPLYPLLTAHLCCALTHLDPRIQFDGLTTLDTLLAQAPGFIKASLDQLLPNCLDQISAKKKPSAQSTGPAVAANLSESLSSLQWRVSVLARVDRMLELVVPGRGQERRQVAVQRWEGGRSYPLISPRPSPLPLSSLGQQTTTSSLKEQVMLVLPLLLETWVEARAVEEREQSKQPELVKEVAELLGCVAGILDKLARMMDPKVLAVAREKFGGDIGHHLLTCLPYSCPDHSCAKPNTQLASLALTLGHPLQPGVLEACLATRGAVGASARLRLVATILSDQDLLPGLRGVCVTALVGLLEGEEGREACQLLRREAVRGPGEEVTAWVRGLPRQLVASLREGGTGSGGLLESCLELAKTRNTDIAGVFIEGEQEIIGEH